VRTPLSRPGRGRRRQRRHRQKPACAVLTRSTSAALASAVPEGRRYTKVRAGMRVSAPISPHWSRRTTSATAAVRARIRST